MEIKGKKKIGELLKDKGLVTEPQLALALSEQKITGKRVGETIIKLGFVSNKDIAYVLAEQAAVQYIDLDNYHVSQEALKLLSKDVCEKYNIIPLAVKKDSVLLGVLDPFDTQNINAVSKVLQMPVNLAVIDNDSFTTAINSSYFFLHNPIENEIDLITKDLIKGTGDPKTTSRLLDLIVMQGIKQRATDIHINPHQDVLYIFYRIDGVLHHAFCIPKSAHTPITARIKILSNLDIAEQRRPQDGAFSYEFIGKRYDMRVSTIPSIHGENVVIRVLSTGSLIRLNFLGFTEKDREILQNQFNKNNGIILITGPTGSGKTTTLYSVLREIDILGRNVVTVEDPVEYKLALIKQTQVNIKAGYDFAQAGRTFMRQDPDVILIGEIRDEQTAQIAVRASITGHLVISTLHANDALTATARLADLDVDKFLLASTLRAVVAQRLGRKLCNFCKVPYSPSEKELALMKDLNPPDNLIIYKEKGCEACNNSGFLGRTIIGEILTINDEVADLIVSSASILKIKEAAARKGMIPMFKAGLQKVIEGITTMKEVQRVT